MKAALNSGKDNARDLQPLNGREVTYIFNDCGVQGLKVDTYFTKFEARTNIMALFIFFLVLITLLN